MFGEKNTTNVLYGTYMIKMYTVIENFYLIK